MRSRPRNDNKFPRDSFASLVLVVVSKTRRFEQPTSANSDYPLPGKENGDEGRKAFDCKCTRHGHKWYQVSDLDVIEFHWEGLDLNKDAVFRTSIDTPLPFQLLTILSCVQWLKTRFSLTRRKTSRTPLHFEKLQCPREQPNPLYWWELAHSEQEQELRMFQIMFMETVWTNYFIVTVHVFSCELYIMCFIVSLLFSQTIQTCVWQKQF